MPQHIWPFDFTLHPLKILKKDFTLHLVKSLCSTDSEESKDLKSRDNRSIMLDTVTKIVEYQINFTYDKKIHKGSNKHLDLHFF